MLARLGRAPVVSIVSIRGRARVELETSFRWGEICVLRSGKKHASPGHLGSQPSDAEIAQRPGASWHLPVDLRTNMKTPIKQLTQQESLKEVLDIPI
jgi:hypothetical protein